MVGAHSHTNRTTTLTQLTHTLAPKLNTHAQRNDAPRPAHAPCSEPEMAERDPSHVPSDGSFAAALLAAFSAPLPVL